MMNPSDFFSGQWSASDFFGRLTRENALAREYGFAFGQCSGLQGFADAMDIASTAPNVILVDDTSEGYSSLDVTPSRRMVKTVYIAMRHAPADMQARAQCFAVMHEIFRQFMSVIVREDVRLREQMIYIDHRIQFSEMDRYFATGAACAFFQISVDMFTDFVYRPDEWISAEGG